MRATVTGGSGSGKSEYAENLAAAYADQNGIGRKFYIAAMKPFGEEAMQRIQRHHALRAQKGFETIECYTGLEQAAAQIAERMSGQSGAETAEQVSDQSGVETAEQMSGQGGAETAEQVSGQGGAETPEQVSDQSGAETAEQVSGLQARCVVLLECMSNLTANEMFDIGGDAEERIRQGINALERACDCLIVVTNDVFSDGVVYDAETQTYNRLLGGLNRFLAGTGDLAVEVVYGCPVVLKGELPCQF